MGIALVLLAGCAAVIYPAARVILTHGVPVIQTNDPSQPETSTNPPSVRSWLALIALIVGGVVGMVGVKRTVDLIDTQWMLLLIAAVFLFAASAVDVGSTVSITRIRPNEVIDIIGGPRQLPARVWLMRLLGGFLATIAFAIFNQILGFGWSFLVVLVLWLTPSIGARYAHNRRAQPG